MSTPRVDARTLVLITIGEARERAMRQGMSTTVMALDVAWKAADLELKEEQLRVHR